ncbi:MAG: DUF4250 domain-containing protein [Bacilli bacterium]|nr:DUF4250 domain-containing protein [Bacilli bacterium]
MLTTKNPVILLSLINTKLRDVYSSLDDLCEDMDTTKEELDSILNPVGYTYDKNQNQYK